MYAYDYDLTLPGPARGRQVRIINGATRWCCESPATTRWASEASISIKAVYELADGSEVYSAAATLTCTVAE